MGQFLFIAVFAGILFVMGISVRSLLIAFGVSFLAMLVLGMTMAFLKFIPWLIVIALVIFFIKKYR